MNIDYFLHKYSSVLYNSDNDHYFSTLKVITGGATSVRMAKLLNFATSLISDGECYLEVGTYTGFTLCSAGFMNGKRCIGVDNFDMSSVGWQSPDPNVVRQHCLNNISRLAPGAMLIESDFRAVTPEQIGSKIAVSFIDGRHETKDVLDNLVWQEPMLADDALIIFDDVGLGAVNRAIRIWEIDHLKNYELVEFSRPSYVVSNEMTQVQDQVLHQGVCILRYKRNGF